MSSEAARRSGRLTLVLMAIFLGLMVALIIYAVLK